MMEPVHDFYHLKIDIQLNQNANYAISATFLDNCIQRRLLYVQRESGRSEVCETFRAFQKHIQRIMLLVMIHTYLSN